MHVVFDRPLREDPALRQPEVLELHRPREEGEVREPETVPAVGIVPPRALLDDVEQLSQRVERGAAVGVLRCEFECGEAVVERADKARAIVCELCSEDGFGVWLEDLELELQIGGVAVGV